MKLFRVFPFVFVLVLMITAAAPVRADDHAESSAWPVFDELIANSDCKTLDGKTAEFAKSLTALPAFLEAVAKPHWYYANVLSQQITQVRRNDYSICLVNQDWPKFSRAELNSLRALEIVEHGELVAMKAGYVLMLHKAAFDRSSDAEKLDALLKATLWTGLTRTEYVKHSRYLSANRRLITKVAETLEDLQAHPLDAKAFGEKLKELGVVVTAESAPLDEFKEKILGALDPNRDLDTRQSFALELHRHGIDPAHPLSLIDADLYEIKALALALYERLYKALGAGNAADFKRAVELGANLYPTESEKRYYYFYRRDDGRLLLKAAVDLGNLEIISEILKDPKTHINDGNYYYSGKTPLRAAVEAKNFEIVSLLANDSRVLSSRGNEDVQFALVSLIGEGKDELVKKLLAQPGITANINTPFYNDQFGYITDYAPSQLPFIRAVELKNYALVKHFIENVKTLDVNAHQKSVKLEPTDDPEKPLRKTQRETALSVAVKNRDLEMVRLLAAAEKIVPVYEPRSWNGDLIEQPLQMAMDNDDFEIAKVIIGMPEFTDTISANSFLNQALKKGQTELAETIASRENGIVADKYAYYTSDKDSRRDALIAAIEKKHTDLALKLLAQPTIQASITDASPAYYVSGATANPFVLAAEKGESRLVEAFLKVPGLNVNQTRKTGNTFRLSSDTTRESALQAAVKARRLDIVKILVTQAKDLQANGFWTNDYDMGTDIERFYSGFSTDRFHSVVAKQQNDSEYEPAPLLTAVRNRDIEIVKLLMTLPTFRANAYAADSKNGAQIDALSIALENNDVPMALLLLTRPEIEIKRERMIKNKIASPYAYAFSHSMWPIVKQMIKNQGLDERAVLEGIYDDKDGWHWNSLGLAVAHDDLEIVKTLLTIPGVTATSPAIFWSKEQDYRRNVISRDDEAANTYDARTLARRMNKKALHAYLNKAAEHHELCIFKNVCVPWF